MPSNDDKMVRVGSSVRIRDGDADEEWRIVASHKADALRGWVSEESPLARALLGHHVGDQVKVQSPAGNRPVTILSVGDADASVASLASRAHVLGCAMPEQIVHECIPIAVLGHVHAILGTPRSWDAVAETATRLERVGSWDRSDSGRLCVYAVEPGSRYYLVEDQHG
jgi:hypothetical protein